MWAPPGVNLTPNFSKSAWFEESVKKERLAMVYRRKKSDLGCLRLIVSKHLAKDNGVVEVSMIKVHIGQEGS
jgi:hypothetical protein